jgi:undecaprenyl-diphosphatase
MNFFIVILLAVVQGAGELLPISSSAHVIIVEKILGLDPTSPEMTFLLVMLHTGTMLAVLLYFWKRWSILLSKQNPHRGRFVGSVVLATAITGVFGLALQWLIEKVVLGSTKGAAVEDLFGNLWIIGTALAAVGILILAAGFVRRKDEGLESGSRGLLASAWVGLIQGLSLPFRGFSRSGSTISVGMLSGLSRQFSEEFSFALAFILTFPVVGRETLRLLDHTSTGGLPWLNGLLGLVFSFAAGLVAIRWLSSWLEKGRWAWFGFYCLAASVTILVLKGTGILN